MSEPTITISNAALKDLISKLEKLSPYVDEIDTLVFKLAKLRHIYGDLMKACEAISKSQLNNL